MFKNFLNSKLIIFTGPNINCDSEFKIPSEQTTSAKFQLPKSSREDMKRSNLDSSGNIIKLKHCYL